MMLSDTVSVARRFQRSIKLDADIGSPGALAGFVCHGSGRAALETMSKLMVENRQHAFTWTGPYGGGKSSLALALSLAVGANPEFRSAARAALGGVEQFDDAFDTTREGWLVVPVIGRRADPVADIREALADAVASAPGRARTKRRRTDQTGRDVIERLVSEAEGRPNDGVLLIIDEMGKFLEGAVSDRADIHFFQELAEAAGRVQGRLIVLGILHQSFDQYAARLGKETRDDWAKIQGRFIDIPVVAAIDEVIDLVGQAIETSEGHESSRKTSARVADAIRKRRPGSPEDLAFRLDACWPLHPVTAALLGPMSRRRFGQNERSVFGFLGSNEPEGFQEFLRNASAGTAGSYDPSRLWDYLRINLEPAILASPDGHRWSQGAEAVERTVARGTALHIRLAKTIALIELLRDGSGIVPERSVLEACLVDTPSRKIKEGLNDLESWSVAIYRKHIGAWGLYAGSDFDIEAALTEASQSATLDFRVLSRLAPLQPILAKQHYHRTGTLRWLDTELVPLSEARERVARRRSSEGAFGALLLAIPDTDQRLESAHWACASASKLAEAGPVGVGLPRNVWLIPELGSELIALKAVSETRPELEGDAVAKREVQARMAATTAELEELLRSAFVDADWFVAGKKHVASDGRSLTKLVSALADRTYPETPIVRSELVNRDKPSSNSQAGVRQLLHAMVAAPNAEHLDIDGYPAERGIYSTVLQVTGLHRKGEDGRLGFRSPNEETEISRSFKAMWQSAEALLSEAEGGVGLDQLYKLWSAPPFGIKSGLLPILAIAFIQAHRSSTAIYIDKRFEPNLNDFVADRLLQNAGDVSLRQVALQDGDREMISQIAANLKAITGRTIDPEPLAVARALVRFVLALPPWAQRTTAAIGRSARIVRDSLARAHDPYQTLVVDLPPAFETASQEEVSGRIRDALDELANAYPSMLTELKERMCASLGHRSGSLRDLRERALTVKDLTGDFRLNAFATRLLEFDDERSAMEAIASLALNKPPRDWSDRDPDQAAIALAELALRFRQAEALAGVKGRKPTQLAMAVVIGAGEEGRTLMNSFDVSEADQAEIASLTSAILRLARKKGLPRETILAALAQSGATIIEADDDETMAVAS